jgi:hypothetical protein
MGGKSGGQSSSQNQQTSTATSGTTQQALPDWLTGAAQQAVGTAQTLSQNPNLFAQYPGQQVADPGAGTLASWNAITGSDPTQMANQIGGAQGALYGDLSGPISGLTAQKQAIYGGLNAGQGLLGNFTGLGPATAQGIAQGAQSMMSPYINNVIGPSMQLGQQALAQNLQQIGAAANQAGAFGGSRQGVMEGVAQAQAALGESNLMANLLNTGWNAALQPASQAALQAGQEGYGANSQLAQMQLQGGQSLGGYVQGDVGGALQAAQGLPEQYIGNLSGMGSQQQSQQQALLNAQMGNYYGAQQQPIQNLDVLLSTLGGVPYGTTTTQNASNLGFGNQAVANQRNPLTGALGGAATGAALGSVIPGVGTAIGGIGGGLLGALGG